MYEDENDNYNYEDDIYATIAFSWNDTKRELSIDDRKGSFPGMLDVRQFNIVLVNKDRGTGIEITKNFDKVLQYQGKRKIVQF